MTIGGDLGLGPYGSAPIAGTEQTPTPTPGTPTAASVSKLTVYAIIDGSPDQESAAVGSLNPYAILDGSPDQASAAVAKLSLYAILEPVVAATHLPEPLFYPGAGPGVFGGARFQAIWAYDVPVVPAPIPLRRRLWGELEDEDDEDVWRPARRHSAGEPPPSGVAVLPWRQLFPVEEDDDEDLWRPARRYSAGEPPPPGVEGLPWLRPKWAEDLVESEEEPWSPRRLWNPIPEALAPLTHSRTTKFIGYIVLDGSIRQESGAVTEFRAYGVLDHSHNQAQASVTEFRSYGLLDGSVTEERVGVTDFRAYGLLDGSITEERVGVTEFRAYSLLRFTFPSPVPPTAPRRFRMGVAEYTHTEGLFTPYKLRGALPDWGTFRSQLKDGQYIRYRARSGHIEEAGYGQFHWGPNTVTRIRALSGTLIEWGPGRRLIYKVDDYWTPPVGELVDAPPVTPTVVGIGEYTHTEGLGPYVLRGPIREWQALANTLHHNQRVLYRCHNSAKEEFGIGTYDAVNNTLIRGPAGISSTAVDWGPGRKLIEILERY